MRPTIRPLVLAGATALLAGGAGCADNPTYVDPRSALEVGAEGGELTAAASFTLPIILENEIELMERTALAERLMLPLDQVPFVRLGDVDVSLEWTVKNLTDTEGEARIKLDGGNPFFFYVPGYFIVDPDEEEPPPPLVGDIPLRIAPLATVSGVFREDQLREASIDLELITRGNLNPFAAILQIHEDLESYQPTQYIDPAEPDLGTMPVGPPLPIEAFAQMIRFDVTFEADRHMVMEWTLRVRQHRSVLHSELSDGPPEELTVFMPAEYIPVLPPE